MTLPRSTIRFAFRFDHLTARPILSKARGAAPHRPACGRITKAAEIKRAQLFREHLEERLGRAVELCHGKALGRRAYLGGEDVGRAGPATVL